MAQRPKHDDRGLVAECIVVVFRMPPGGMGPGPEGSYLARARSMCARGEALGGRLVAWSGALLGVAWDTDSMEEALLLAANIREETRTTSRAWACGVAEGELEDFTPEGGRMHMAWGEPLLRASSLARIAKAGEVLVDGDVRALRAGQLALVGARAATDAGERVRGWKLDLDHPWKRGYDGAAPASDRAERHVIAHSGADAPSADAAATLETQALQFLGDELATSEVLQIIESAAMAAETSTAPRRGSRRGHKLAERLRQLSGRQDSGDAIEALAQLRRARAEAEGGTSAARCQAALALAVALMFTGRPEEGLLDALDALARAREGHDVKAIGACLALLSKLYAGADRPGEAAALREGAGLA